MKLGRLLLAFMLLFLSAGAWKAEAGESLVESLLNQAQGAQSKGDIVGAIALANKAVQMAPTNAQCYYIRGRLHAAERSPAKAIEDFDRAVELEPRAAEIYQLRGIEFLRIGALAESLTDFNTFLKFAPKEEPFQWQRGVAMYLAGDYEAASKQFEMRHSVATNDVENAIWHFLCVMRIAGLEKARASLFAATADASPVLDKLHGLCAGKATPQDVIAVVQSGGKSSAPTKPMLFTAAFYLALYYDAIGEKQLALANAAQAAGKYRLNTLLGDVAVVYFNLLQKGMGQPAR